MATAPTTTSIAQRFWRKVTIGDDCWEWQGTLTKDGYGELSAQPRRVSAHRWSYERLIGPIPDGKHIDHLCRNRKCVNPRHLEPVTPRENTLRGEGPPARNARKTHCPQGHAYIEANVYQLPTGGRACRVCKRNHRRESAARRRQQLRSAVRNVASTGAVARS